MNLYENKVMRLAGNNHCHPATEVVLLLMRLKMRFFATLFSPYFTNKTTLVALKHNCSPPTLLPYFQTKHKYDNPFI